jgi:hypothetical protein
MLAIHWLLADETAFAILRNAAEGYSGLITRGVMATLLHAAATTTARATAAALAALAAATAALAS